MIVLKLTDGLGNQMFQYAFARALQQRRNDKIYLDITKLGYGHIRSYSLDQFVLNEQVIVPIPLFQWMADFIRMEMVMNGSMCLKRRLRVKRI